MSLANLEQLVRQIHESGTRFVLAVTGGGSGAVLALFGVPGASRSMLLATVPYSEAALVEWLGAKPASFCSARTARAMAMAAYQRARMLEPDGERLAGVACTASLASDRPKLGPHRFYIAVQTAEQTACVSIELNKGQRSRAEEEGICTSVVLSEMASLAACAGRLEIAWLPGEIPQLEACVAPVEWQQVVAGGVQRIPIGTGGQNCKLVFPGAFNPLHAGHIEMAKVASRILGSAVDFELSIVNVDKPPLDFLEIEARAKQFTDVSRLWLTRAPTFVEKAGLFPGMTFVVGIDTLIRIADARYYGGDERQLAMAIDRIAGLGCRFLVFGRTAGGQFRTLDELAIPASLSALCRQVPEADFRADVSSTELRQSADF